MSEPIYGFLIAMALGTAASFLVTGFLYAMSFYPACVHLTYSTCY